MAWRTTGSGWVVRATSGMLTARNCILVAAAGTPALKAVMKLQGHGFAPLSAENRAWVESTWAADVALWNTYCAATARSDRVEANAPVWGELLPARKPHQVTTTAPESLHEIHG